MLRSFLPARCSRPDASSALLGRTAARRGRGGYTLVEVAVGLALTMLLLVVGAAWVSTLLRASGTAAEQQSSNRDVEFVEVRLSEDLDAARPCRDDAGGWAFSESTVSRVVVYADVVDGSGVTGADGVGDLVVWDVVDQQLRRSVSVGVSACTFGSTTTATMLPSVEADGANPFFVAYAPDGTIVTSADCGAAGAACDVGSVRVRLVAVRDSLDAVPVSVDLSVPAARLGRWFR